MVNYDTISKYLLQIMKQYKMMSLIEHVLIVVVESSYSFLEMVM